MRWPPVGKGRGAPGSLAGRPGPAPRQRLAPTFGAAVPPPAPRLPGNGQANLQYGLLPARQALYDAPLSQHSMHAAGPSGEAPGHYGHPKHCKRLALWVPVSPYTVIS